MPMKALRVLKLLYVQVLIATAAGILVGLLFPQTGEALRPLGDAFIKVIRMIIAPGVFSTLALIIGLVVANVVRPGPGFNIDAASLDPNIAAQYTKGAASMSFVDQMMKIIPDTMVSAFVTGDLLQVLLVAILTGFACSRLGSFGAQVAHGLENVTKVLFSIIRIIVWSASVGAFGAMAFTIGRYGVQSLVPLAVLIATFYLTAFLFVVFVLGSIARAAGFS